MIAKASLILSKAALVHQAKTIRLEEMTTESIQIQHSGVEKRITLEEIKSLLETMAAFNLEKLKHRPC